ncbi:YIP1 family protein [Halorientalis marina]|uniref:YIP1 family protein n=1 Tax=Halorientalis marina TaxID=2931976 RepID=UPI001FF63A48|nr:YIP1 family protein [Halorientalis marina]
MTQWVENPTGGRDRGPVAILRAWAEVLVRPRRFFRGGVAPGDQAPGLVFAAVVVLVEELTRLALVGGIYPTVGGQPAASTALFLALAVVLVMPATLHLTAALQTLILMATAPDRGGVSETVQVLAYATAPCVIVGVPVPAVRFVGALYGVVLLVVGTSVVHGTSVPKTVPLVAVPAAIVFGYGFRGFGAGAALLADLGYGSLLDGLLMAFAAGGVPA